MESPDRKMKGHKRNRKARLLSYSAIGVGGSALYVGGQMVTKKQEAFEISDAMLHAIHEELYPGIAESPYSINLLRDILSSGSYDQIPAGDALREAMVNLGYMPAVDVAWYENIVTSVIERASSSEEIAVAIAVAAVATISVLMLKKLGHDMSGTCDPEVWDELSALDKKRRSADRSASNAAHRDSTKPLKGLPKGKWKRNKAVKKIKKRREKEYAQR